MSCKYCTVNTFPSGVLIIKNADFQVSWIRHKDTLLLAIGRYTYTSDYRFKAIHKLMSEDYLLQIRPVQVNKPTQKNTTKSKYKTFPLKAG
jgi:hypothetical protein